ncbi:MAG: fatty acid desaturase [Deltaproteobacteria bacterium]|nr:fatty acid desaturase [Deltaproteobacteria bacterium]
MTATTGGRLRRINWVTTLFLLSTPLVAAVWGALHISAMGIGASELAVFAFYVCATGFSITTGYHRHFAHGAYECSRVVKVFYLLFGAAAFQHSVLSWCSDHRRHHKYIDRDEDPYNITRGFFWAHIGWLLVTDHKRAEDFSNVPDLVADPWIRRQHAHYLPIAVVMGFVVPFALGAMVGHPWGFVLWAGVFRVVLVHHSTFLVNSLAHRIGRRPYLRAISARDSIVTALLTFGEGYHNFHHRFATDYRNGIGRAAWDPTKWLIRGLEMIGLAWELRRVPTERIVAAELDCDSERLSERLARVRGSSEQAVAHVRARFAEMAASVQRAAAALTTREREVALARRRRGRDRAGQLRPLRAELRAARLEMRAARVRWHAVLAELLEGPLAVSPSS